VTGPSQIFVAQIGLGQPSLVLVWKISPRIFHFFPSGKKKSHQVWSKSTQIKDGFDSYLLWVIIMLGLGQFMAYLYFF